MRLPPASTSSVWLSGRALIAARPHRRVLLPAELDVGGGVVPLLFGAVEPLRPGDVDVFRSGAHERWILVHGRIGEGIRHPAVHVDWWSRYASDRPPVNHLTVAGVVQHRWEELDTVVIGSAHVGPGTEGVAVGDRLLVEGRAVARRNADGPWVSVEPDSVVLIGGDDG